MKDAIMALACIIFLINLNACTKESATTEKTPQTKTIVSAKTEQAPVIDGAATDAAWEKAGSITAWDNVAKLEIRLKSVHTDNEVFFLVTFPDQTENRKHRAQIWDKEKSKYIDGPSREDVFVMKWAMDPSIDDLSITADRPYDSDIWFWKADRTDPASFADDKLDRYSVVELPESIKLRSASGNYFYLARLSDSGKSAFALNSYDSFQGENLPKYKSRTPEGSLADIRAKGVWQNNQWTIEFGRKLVTGNADDVAFDVNKQYFFGVSRFEISGRAPENNSEEPLYGCGEVFDKLMLSFK